MLTRQTDLYWLLTREKGGFADAQQGRIALQEALRGRSCLVVERDPPSERSGVVAGYGVRAQQLAGVRLQDMVAGGIGRNRRPGRR